MSEPRAEERDDCCHMTHEWGTACPLPNPTVVFVDSSQSPPVCTHPDVDHGHGVPPYCKDCGQQMPPEWLPPTLTPTPADRLAQAFDEWVSLSVKRMPIRPMGGAPSLEELDRAWRKVTQAHEEWSNAR